MAMAFGFMAFGCKSLLIDHFPAMSSQWSEALEHFQWLAFVRFHRRKHINMNARECRSPRLLQPSLQQAPPHLLVPQFQKLSADQPLQTSLQQRRNRYGAPVVCFSRVKVQMTASRQQI